MDKTKLAVITASSGAAVALSDPPLWLWLVWGAGNVAMWVVHLAIMAEVTRR